MKRSYKITGGIIIILLIGYIYSQSESHMPFFPYIDTIFAKQFTWKNFDKVENGMNEEQVTKLLGQPLNKAHYGSSTIECWNYTNDGKVYPYADFSWYSVKVCFKNGLVDSKPVIEFND